MLAGLEHADSGEIIIDGRVVNDVPASERGIGFVFQNYALFRYMTVYDNIAFGLDVKKWKKADIRRRVDELVELVGLKGFEKRYPNQLSGGQRQRAWIAMTLAQETEMILLDEPTTYLDMAYQLDVLQLLERMNREKQLTIVMVLHDLNEACRFADHIIGLKNGKVVCEGRPADVITRENIREIYGIDAKLVMSDGGYPICMEFDRVIKTL